MTIALPPRARPLITADPAAVRLGPTAVAIGMFDGVHRGHRRLIGECRRRADRDGLACGVVTFADHPAALLAPHRKPALLSTPPDRIALLEGCGVDFVLVLPLTARLLGTSPEVFVEDLLVRDLAARTVVVGRNFRFGNRAAGDPALLARLGRPHDVATTAVDLVDDGGAPVSSTRIRAEIAAGRVHAAAALLERPHSLRIAVTSRGPHGIEGMPHPGIAVPRPATYRGVLLRADGRDEPASVAVRPDGRSITSDAVAAVGENVRIDFLSHAATPPPT